MVPKENPETDRKILRFFSAIADPTRLRILLSIVDGPKTVNDIYTAVGRGKMTLSAISHQLKQLEQAGVVQFDKNGREKAFRLSEGFCWCILRDAYKHFGSGYHCSECAKIRKK